MKGPSYRLATFAVWALSTFLLFRRYRGIFDLDPEDQKLIYYSESAFYLSFYHDVVEAPDWFSLWKMLLYDDRTEFPTTVVAFRRLNIMQELILGIIYRLFNIRSISKNPFCFYASAVLVLNAGGVATLFLLACKCGKSTWAGVLFYGLYLSNFQERLISRISALPLRENFALPALWLSILCIRDILERRKNDSHGPRRLLFVAFTWMFFTWQLSLHLVATQLGCLFLLNLLTVVSDDDLWQISKTAFLSLLTAWLIMFCPPFLVTSHLISGVIAILVTLLLLPSGEGKIPLMNSVQKLLLVFAIFAFETSLLTLTARHDAHIIEMLLSKLGLSKPTFDSQIYLLGAEFRPLTMNVIRMILPTRLFHYSCAALIVMLFLTCMNCRPISGFRREFNCYFALQIVVFAMMALLVSRLRVLALPLLCVFAGYSMLFFRLPGLKGYRAATFLAASVALAPYMTTLPLNELRVAPYGELFNNQEIKDLVTWVNRNVEAGTPILSDMPTSSALRASTHARIVINPQFEYVPLRRKTHFFYTLGDCNDARWFGEKMRDWYQTEIVVVPVKFCAIPQEGGPHGVQLLLSLNPLGTCPPRTSYASRLCNRLWAGDPHFEQLYSNERYLVFRFRGIDTSADEPSWRSMHQLDHYKPWIKNHVLSDNELGPRQISSTAHALKTHYNSTVVFPLLSYGLKVFPDSDQMLRLYAEAMDYDLGMFEEAKRHYNILFKRMGSRCKSPEDLEFYTVYLSHLVDTHIGSAAEVIEVIEASTNCLKLDFPRPFGKTLCDHSIVIMRAFHNYFAGERFSVRNAAARFFFLSQNVNHQNECFFKNYTLFNAVNLTTLDVLVMFLTSN